jgi:FkbM family methyltransferase
MGSPSLARLLEAVGPINCLDVGARDEPVDDLLAIAGGVSIIGFEPDPGECDRLNAHFTAATTAYRSVRFLPVAIGQPPGTRTLHLTAHRGASSFLAPDPRVKGRYFGTDSFFEVDRELPVEVRGLDEICAEYGIADAAFMKVDVEGCELEVFRSAPALLSTELLVVRCEVAFVPTRIGQPGYCELAEFMRSYHFVPMDFLFLHHWRERTRRAQRRLSAPERRVYRRRLAHGDVLFVRDPDCIDPMTDGGVERLVKEAVLLYAYGFFDAATAILERDVVRPHVAARYGVDVDRLADEVAADFSRRARGPWWRRFFNTR